MLLRFNVSNFMSISEEQELSMYCGNVGGFEERIVSTDDINVLKFSKFMTEKSIKYFLKNDRYRVTYLN